MVCAALPRLCADIPGKPPQWAPLLKHRRSAEWKGHPLMIRGCGVFTRAALLFLFLLNPTPPPFLMR